MEPDFRDMQVTLPPSPPMSLPINRLTACRQARILIPDALGMAEERDGPLE